MEFASFTENVTVGNPVMLLYKAPPTLRRVNMEKQMVVRLFLIVSLAADLVAIEC